MADMLGDAMAWLTDQMIEHASRMVTYARGVDSVDVSATPGRKRLQSDDGFGNVRVEWTDADFLIRASDLDWGAGPVEPEKDDIIFMGMPTHDDPLEILVFQVLPFGRNPAWTWSDPQQTMRRIHAKLKTTESQC